MKIRDMKPGEEPLLWQLHRTTVMNVNRRDYSPEQLKAWASEEIEPATWVAKMQAISPFVVEHGGEIVGYSDLQPSGLIDHFFVHHQWQRKGVGSLLMRELERRSNALGLDKLEAHVSLTARPFFESRGFRVEKAQSVPLRGQILDNFFMIRNIAGHQCQS